QLGPVGVGAARRDVPELGPRLGARGGRGRAVVVELLHLDDVPRLRRDRAHLRLRLLRGVRAAVVRLRAPQDPRDQGQGARGHDRRDGRRAPRAAQRRDHLTTSARGLRTPACGRQPVATRTATRASSITLRTHAISGSPTSGWPPTFDVVGAGTSAVRRAGLRTVPGCRRLSRTCRDSARSTGANRTYLPCTVISDSPAARAATRRRATSNSRCTGSGGAP